MKSTLFQVVILFVPLLAQAQSVKENLVRAYQVRADQGYLIGAAAAVVTPQKEDLQLTFGEAQSVHDRFSIGSISKSFTGILLAKLSLEHKIDLNAPIETLVPELKGSFAGTVTPQLLATHSARLLDDVAGADTFSDSQMITYLKGYVPGVDRPAGERNYSNLGFMTLALIIRRVTHENFADLIQREIFKPLSMTESGFLNSKDNFKFMLKPHDVIQGETHYDLLLDLAIATGGIYSSISDMTQFLKMNLNPDQVKTLAPAIRLSHTLGLGWDSEPGSTMIEKNGAMSGFGSKIRFDLNSGFGAIAMCNSRCTMAATELVNVAFGKPDSFKADPVVEATDLDWISRRYVSSTGDYALTVKAGYHGLIGMTFSRVKKNETIMTYRLIRYDSTRYRIYDGLGSLDYVQFIKNTTSQKLEIHYFSFVKIDENGKPVYHDDDQMTESSH